MTKLPAQTRLRRRREDLGLSRRELAQKAGVAVSRIWAAEDVSSDIKDEDRDKIVKALNSQVDYIANLGHIN